MKILAFGEVLWDVYPDSRHLGGAVMNFSAHAARLGADIYFASAVGSDSEGADAIRLMTNWGIKTECVAVTDAFETGKCMVSLDERSIPTYDLLQNVAYDHIPMPRGEFEVLCFGTLALRGSENTAVIKELLKNDFREIFVDINIRPPFYSNETIALCLNNATILKISDEELSYVCEDTDLEKAAEAIIQQHQNIKILIITMGEKGAAVYNGKIKLHKDAVPANVISTVGAGDSFSAAFLVNYLNEQPLENCLDTAVRLSSFVVSSQAAVPDYNGRDFI